MIRIQLDNLHALVCGASKGIGKACAEALAEAGANVTLLARSEDTLLQTMASLAVKNNQKHGILITDLSNPDELTEKIKSLVEKSPVHILVNNTGGPPAGPIVSAERNQFESAFLQHLICNHLLATHTLEGMKSSGYGRIINIISTSVKQPLDNLGVSNTVRAAVANWAKTLSNELAEFNITVNNVLPGATNTERLQNIIDREAKFHEMSQEEVTERMIANIPMKRFAKASEIANAVAFLASPLASYITGINIPVDGGRTKCL